MPAPVLRVALVLALVATTLVGVTARSEAVHVPETLTHRAPVAVAPVHTPFAIDHLGVLWDVEGDHAHGHDHDGHDHGHDHDGHGGGDEHVAAHNVDGLEPNGAVRFLDADGVWGPWIRLIEDGAEGEGHWASGLVAAGGAVAYQVRGLPDDVIAPRGVALNVTDGPPVEVASRPTGSADALTDCLSRAEWGADENLRFDDKGNEIWPPDFYDAQVMTVHHTATTNDDPDPAGTVRAIYRYHAVDRGWGDIGYHHLIDEDGRVYEGRWSGEASAPCSGTDGGDGTDFAHNDLDEVVTAAHTGGSNSGNLGVALLGEFTQHPRFGAEPKATAVAALEDTLAELAVRHAMDPLGTVHYVNPVSGDERDVDTISGHRDFTSTECPGERLYDQLDQIRPNVAEKMDEVEPAVAVTIDEPADGATLASGASITFSATVEDGATVVWTSDVDGELGTGSSITAVLTDGAHEVTATATLDGATGSDTVSVTVGDTQEETGSTLSVSGIAQSADGGRHLLIEITVLDGDAPAAGAAVTAEVWHADASGTPTSLREQVSGTTDGDGYVRFRVRVRANPPGCYTTVITGVGLDGATWDEVSPTPQPDPYCF